MRLPFSNPSPGAPGSRPCFGRYLRQALGPDEPFWQKRYYDRNVRSVREFGIKLRYLHRNPRGPQAALLLQVGVEAGEARVGA